MKKHLFILLALCLLFTGVIESVNAGGRETDTGRWPDNTIPVVLVDPDGRYVGISNQGDNGLLTAGVDWAHHETHEGNHYVIQMNDTLGVGEKMQMILNTPSSPDIVHFICIHSSSAEAYIEFWRSPTFTYSVANTITPSNRDDSKGDNSGMEVYHTPVISNAGTFIPGYGDHFGAGQTKGGESRGAEEFMFRPDTTYLMNVVSEAASNRITVTGDFYVESGDAP